MISELKVGPQTNSDGAQTTARGSKDGAVVTGDSHGRYFEAASRGRIFTLTSTIAALPGVALNLATGGSPVAAIYNPLGSNKAAVILRGGILPVGGVTIASAAVGFGSCWNYLNNQVITAAINATPVPHLLNSSGGATAMRGYSNTVLTGQSTTAFLQRPFNAVFTSTSTVASMVFAGPFELENTNGDLVVPPGTFLALMPTTTATALTAMGVIEYEEVDYP